MIMLGEPKPEISVVVENYLQAIYKLHEREERVYPTRLAEVMTVSLATITVTLKRLIKQGMISVSKDREITFTDRGKDIGESVVRRHRLAERMLTELLGVEWHLAHAEAHRLEHAISPYVEMKLAESLGFPETNPFGMPIPGYCSNLKIPPMKPLSEASGNEVAVVERVPEEDFGLLEYLSQVGIVPGTKLKVIDVAQFKGIVEIDVDGQKVVLGTGVADKLLIRA